MTGARCNTWFDAGHQCERDAHHRGGHYIANYHGMSVNFADKGKTLPDPTRARTHLEVTHEVTGDWQTACGTFSNMTSGSIENIDCIRCLAWYRKHGYVVLRPATLSPGTTEEP